eukprot:704123-Prymnesium_polylepis.1
MVREPALALRDELLGLQQRGELGSSSGIIVNGPAGCGKSAMLNYALCAACAREPTASPPRRERGG